MHKHDNDGATLVFLCRIMTMIRGSAVCLCINITSNGDGNCFGNGDFNYHGGGAQYADDQSSGVVALSDCASVIAHLA